MEPYTAPDRKHRYADFCARRGDVPVFISPWWLDQDAGPEGWDVVLAALNGEIIAALPCCFTRLRWFKGIGMPPVAPYQGYFIAYPPEQKGASRLAWEHKAVSLLFKELPPHSFFFQHFPPGAGPWTPLYQLGYRQTTKYSYIITDLSDLDSVFAGFENRARTAVRKAEHSLAVNEAPHAGELAALLALTYRKQGLSIPYELERLARLTNETASRGQGKIYVAKDAKGYTHAAAFAVWDQQTAYYTIQAADPARLSDGGAALLVWHAIQDAAQAGMKAFDFTGSMMPGVEKFLRAFGGTPLPRHYIYKENGLLLYILMRLKEYRESSRLNA